MNAHLYHLRLQTSAFLSSTVTDRVAAHPPSRRLHCSKCQLRPNEIHPVSACWKSSLILECRWRINPKLHLLKFIRVLCNSTNIQTMLIYRKYRGKKSFCFNSGYCSKNEALSEKHTYRLTLCRFKLHFFISNLTNLRTRAEQCFIQNIQSFPNVQATLRNSKYELSNSAIFLHPPQTHLLRSFLPSWTEDFLLLLLGSTANMHCVPLPS